MPKKPSSDLPSRKRNRRFQKYDAHRNRLLLISVAVTLLWPIIPMNVLDTLGYPEYANYLVFPYLLGFLGWFVFVYNMIHRLTRRYDLRCSKCGRPLDYPIPLPRRLSPEHPDYRVDGERPRRCPHCHISIKVALSSEAWPIPDKTNANDGRTKVRGDEARV